MPYRIVHRPKARKPWIVMVLRAGRWIKLGATTTKAKALAMIRAVEASKARQRKEP